MPRQLLAGYILEGVAGMLFLASGLRSGKLMWTAFGAFFLLNTFNGVTHWRRTRRLIFRHQPVVLLVLGVLLLALAVITFSGRL